MDPRRLYTSPSMLRGLVILACLTALPAFAGYANHDLVVPVVGHAVGGDGRTFDTTVWLTNATDSATNVTLTFLPAGKSSPARHASSMHLAPHETKLLSADAQLLGAPFGTGALRIEANGDVVADAQIANRAANDPEAHTVATSFSAIPRSFAIGNGQSSIVHGVALHDPYRFRLYVSEITGEPLHFVVSLLDASGGELARKQLYVNGWEHLPLNVSDEFANVTSAPAALRISGINGSGRIALLGTRTANGSQDTTAFEMSLPTEPRNRVPWWEAFVYIAAAAAIIFAIVRGRR